MPAASEIMAQARASADRARELSTRADTASARTLSEQATARARASSEQARVAAEQARLDAQEAARWTPTLPELTPSPWPRRVAIGLALLVGWSWWTSSSRRRS